ncbi:hypothetical protein HDU76_013729 [Blyttiomyces sp. JEL0837]|nr:hypothetical protein HDU76_013729 [Blyttiomyces sp. JEL0837]
MSQTPAVIEVNIQQDQQQLETASTTSSASSSPSSNATKIMSPTTATTTTTATIPSMTASSSNNDIEKGGQYDSNNTSDLKKDTDSVKDKENSNSFIVITEDSNEVVDTDIGPPPDGGWTAWLVVLGSFIIHFVVLGMSYFLEQKLASSSVIAFIGTFGAAVLPGLGLVSGRLAERFGFQRMILIGSIILSLGLFLASFETAVWHLFLTQGLLFGIGASIAYFPAVSAPSQWFSKYRGLATGIAVSGSGIGGLVMTLVIEKLLTTVGYAWTMRISAIFSIVTLLATIPLIKTRIPPAPHSKTDWSILKDTRFLLLILTGFFATFANLVPLYFLPLFAQERLGLTKTAGAVFLSIYNGSSALGRIGMGVGADSILGRINSLVFCMVISALSMLLIWTFANTYGVLVLFAVINGFVAGGFISLFPVVIAAIFGAERLPSLVGMLFSASAIGNLSGPPLAGVLKDIGGFTAAIMYAGGVTLISSVFVTIVRFRQEKVLFKRV